MESLPFVILDCSKISGKYSRELIKCSEFQNFATKLGNGLSSGGGEMVYFINHEIPQEIVDDVFLQSRKFFELDPERKLKYKKVDPANNFHGYTSPYGEETANPHDVSVQDFKESFSFVGKEICGENYPNEEVPKLRPSVLKFHSAMANFGKKVLLALGLYLKLDDPEFFVVRHKGVDNLLNPEIEHWTDIRTNYYMALDNKTLASLGDHVLRLGEHCDWGTLTFLIQDQDGLEAKVTNDDGKADWIPVPPIPGSILLNSGLFLENWSGGRFPATPHRVKLIKGRAHEERQSLVWFMPPDGKTKSKALVEKFNGWSWSHEYPQPGKDETATQYFSKRIKEIFASQYKY